MERHRELVGKYNKYIESNPTTMSSNHTDLYSNYVTSTPNTDHILLTIQRTSRRGKDTSSAIKGIAPAKESTSANQILPNY